MRIGIVGGGIVGHATARSYIEHVDEVRVYDIVETKRTHSLSEVLECDLIFVCLPTPQKEGSLECDVSAIDNFFFTICETFSCVTNRNFVLRSTVPIGTTKMLRSKYGLINLVHSPEFLTARCAVTDAQLPSRNIIGDPKNNGEWSDCMWALRRLYESRFPHVNIIFMSSDESEAVKLFQNSFFAVKIAFWNECHMLATKLELDWDRVMEGILSDGRISPSHTKVPGHHGFGFSGECLPKDLASLVTQMIDNGLHGLPYQRSTICSTALMRNIEDRKRK